jgi:hypothetical protein
MIFDVLGDQLVSASPGKGEVVQAGDAEHGVVNAVAFQSAVAKDLPALHPGEDVLHAGADFAVGGVVFLLPGREYGQSQGSRVTVSGQVGLGAQPAAGASECVVGRLVSPFGPFLRAPAACWWARTTVESTETVQPMSSAASAAARTFSRVPPTAHLISRL